MWVADIHHWPPDITRRQTLRFVTALMTAYAERIRQQAGSTDLWQP